MIGNLVGGSAEPSAKKSGGNRAQKADEPESQTDEVKEENNENE
jgi:hypothetical protein